MKKNLQPLTREDVHKIVKEIVEVNTFQIITVLSDHISEQIAAVRQEAAGNKAELKAELKKNIDDVRREALETKIELKQDIAAVRKEAAETKAELKRDIASIRKEALETKYDLKEHITNVKYELKKDVTDLRQEVYVIRDELKEDRFDKTSSRSTKISSF